jgi:hypothetical protein
MKKKAEKREQRDELRGEYDLSKLKGRMRGKYVARYRAGTNLVLLSPDVAECFPDEQSVNAALRGLIRVAKRRLRPAAAGCAWRTTKKRRLKTAPFQKQNPKRASPARLPGLLLSLGRSG